MYLVPALTILPVLTIVRYLVLEVLPTTMQLINHQNCPNAGTEQIDPRFLIVHYTACSLAKTLETFFTPGGTAAHFVIDVDGTVHQIIPHCLSGTCYRGAHAGKSSLSLADGSTVEGLNGHSIGIELVNRSGHVFPYPAAQLESLITLSKKLFELYPATNDPKHVIGHADVAGFRGKVDPGAKFPWRQFLAEIFPQLPPVELASLAASRNIALTANSRAYLHESLAAASEEEKSSDEFWMKLSLKMEQLNSATA